MSFEAIPYPGGGYEIPRHKTGTVPPPALGNLHQWVSTVLFAVSQQTVEEAAASWMSGGTMGISLDHENLMSVHGPTCLKCHTPLTATSYQQPCPVHVIPVWNRPAGN